MAALIYPAPPLSAGCPEMAAIEWVYLLHFDRAIGRPDNPRARAQHYIGWTPGDLRVRLRTHRLGNSDASRIMAHLAREGIGWTLVRCWNAGVDVEKALKRMKMAPRMCPICSPRPRSLRRFACYEVSVVEGAIASTAWGVERS